MLKTRQIEIAAPSGNPCSRSGHLIQSDFADFGDFEQELVEAIAADADESDDSKEPDE